MICSANSRRFFSVLLTSLSVWAVLISSSLIYADEGDVQPEQVEAEIELEPESELPAETEAPINTEEVVEADEDIMSLDIENAIEEGVNQKGLLVVRSDVRGSYIYSDIDERDGTTESDDDLIVRLRSEVSYNPYETLRFSARAAMRCAYSGCSPSTTFASTVEGNTLDDGDATIDSAFVHWFRRDSFDISVGRMQTRFVSRGGVFAKSLDRNNSHNSAINWTDGIHLAGSKGLPEGWLGHWISEFNHRDGSSSVRREPLDFDDSSAKYSHFLAFENNQPLGYVVQRGIDVSYLPKSLLHLDGTREDYWGVVGRLALRFPTVNDSSIRLATEVGYAPDTPKVEDVDVNGQGESHGTAWNVSVSAMNFMPDHSVGFLYGETESGWLLSPQYRNNEQLIELRWSWRPNLNLIVDSRIRRRQVLDQLMSSSHKKEEYDFFLRMTWRFTKERAM